jgi:hypothetical protein
MNLLENRQGKNDRRISPTGIPIAVTWEGGVFKWCMERPEYVPA